MILIFVWIGKKVDVAALLENAKNSVIETIEKSKKEKQRAAKDFKNAQKALVSVEADVKETLKNAKTQANFISKKLLAEAEEKVKQFEITAKRAIENEEKTACARLTNLAAQKSVEIARNEIIAALKENPALHEQFIKESIEKL
jgi:F0F1-type ATP synthase membrane subunit b/b'